MSEEKLTQLAEDLSEIKTSIAVMIEGQKRTALLLHEHHTTLYHDENGLKIKVDRLNEHKKNTEKTFYIVWVTAVGLILKTMWDAFISNFHK